MAHYHYPCKGKKMCESGIYTWQRFLKIFWTIQVFLANDWFTSYKKQTRQLETTISFKLFADSSGGKATLVDY